MSELIMYTSRNNDSVKIATRFEVYTLIEKSSWHHPIEPFNGFEYGFYVGNGSYPSDDYRSSPFNVNSDLNYYRGRLWELIKKIINKPDRYLDVNFKQSKPSDSRLKQLLELVYELDVNGGYLLIVDSPDDIEAAEILVRAINYLYDNNFGVELNF